MNHIKLLKFNLARPINARVSQAEIASRLETVQSANQWRKGWTLLQSIRAEIAPKLEAMRQADDIMDAIGSVSGGMSCHIARKGPTKATEPAYRYSFGTMEPSLAGENDSFSSVYQRASNRAFEHTQTTAGGQHAND